MVTGNYNSLVQEAAIELALDNLDDKPDDTGLLVGSAVDEGQRVVLTSMIDGLTRPPIPRMHAKRVLDKRLPGGNPAFWIPGMPYEPPKPAVGSIKCMLHPEFDEEHGPAGFNREFVDDAGLMGFFCNRGDQSKQNRANFLSVYDRDQHMHSKHGTQLEIIEKAQGKQSDIEAQAERQLDREIQQATTAAILAAVGGEVPVAVTEASPAETVTLPAVEVSENLPVAPVFTCDVCTKESPTRGGIAAHKRLSKDAAHVEAREAS